MIKTTSYSQKEILNWIFDLYLPSRQIECDVTYGKGAFYKGRLTQPTYKFDINPQREGVVGASCTKLPVPDEKFNSVAYDPPFVVSHGKNSIMGNFYSSFRTAPKLWKFYKESMIELDRVLAPEGLLIVKCQDLTQGGKNFLSHIEITNIAVSLGLYPKDLFILMSRSKLMSPHQLNQLHARKFHCYFLVFKKTKSPTVKYSGLND